MARATASVLRAAACVVAIAACGHASETAPSPRGGQVPPRSAPPAATSAPAAPDVTEPADAQGSAASQEALAAIQKAMNELDEAAQHCWAAAATVRFDLAGEVTLQVEVAAEGRSKASVVHDTAQSPKLASCLVALLSGYRWAPPLHGRAIQLPFGFRAPDGQNTIDRTLVPWSGQGQVSVAVLLDASNAGNAAASMLELAIERGGTTGLRWADRAELWYFLGAAQVRSPAGTRSVAEGDMMYAPPGSAREVRAASGDLHAVIVVVPGGREGTARAGALPTREVGAGERPQRSPMILPASSAKTYGPATVFADAKVLPGAALAASILVLPAGQQVAEHVHARETEMLYVLAGGGTMTVNGVALPVIPTSVVQVPKNTRHAFTATSEVRALQIYTPAGPEQRFKAHP